MSLIGLMTFLLVVVVIFYIINTYIDPPLRNIFNLIAAVVFVIYLIQSLGYIRLGVLR